MKKKNTEKISPEKNNKDGNEDVQSLQDRTS